jgi:hypothetical protein
MTHFPLLILLLVPTALKPKFPRCSADSNITSRCSAKWKILGTAGMMDHSEVGCVDVIWPELLQDKYDQRFSQLWLYNAV